MTIYVLIVEDDENYIDGIQTVINTLPGEFNCAIARSRDEAFEKLEEYFLDLVILDLKIPTVTAALDADTEHGHAVFHKIRSVAPGTPIFVLTGSPAEDFIPALLDNQQQMDIWGEGNKTGTIQFLPKYRFNECAGLLLPIATAIEGLAEVELDRLETALTLSEDRLIRIFARKFHGVRCVVSSLGGGLSGATVVRLRVTDSQGAPLHDAVAKLGNLAEVRKEGECFNSHVVRLHPATTPRNLANLEFGAYKSAGIFFGLSEGFDESAFSFVKNASERSIDMIRNIESATLPWVDGVPESRKAIKEIRTRVLCDESLEEIRAEFDLNWIQDFEDREILILPSTNGHSVKR